MTIALDKSINVSSNIVTLEEFLLLPETKPAKEYIDDQIYQKTMPQGQHSTLQTEICTAINQISKPNKIAFAFPELRCTFTGISIIPDICVLRWSNIPFETNKRVGNQVLVSPDWIIEILSPGQSPLLVINKIGLSIRNGSQIGWLISPSQDSILVFVGDQLPEIKKGSDILPVLDVLQDWQVSVDDVLNLLNLA